MSEPEPALSEEDRMAAEWADALAQTKPAAGSHVASEVALGPDDGLPTQCVASLDNILTFPKSMLTRRAGRLESERWSGVCDAIRAAVDC